MLHSGGHGPGRLPHHRHLHRRLGGLAGALGLRLVDEGPLEDADWQERGTAEMGDTVDAVFYLASRGRLKLRLVERETAGPENDETFAVAVDPS